MNIFVANIFIAVFFAWTYLNDGAPLIGFLGFVFLIGNILVHLVLLAATSNAKTKEGLRIITEVMLARVGKEALNGEALDRFLYTVGGLVSSLAAGLTVIMSGFPYLGFSYMALSGYSMHSVASLDDRMRAFANKLK
jgi:hypothetical protein